MTKESSLPIVVIVTECPYSGILRAIIEHAKILFSMGFNLKFIVPETPRDRYGEKSLENKKLLAEYGNVYTVPLRRKYRYILQDKVLLRDKLGEFNNKIVLSYTGYAGKICRLLYRDGCIPILYHVPQCVDVVRRAVWQRPIESFAEHFLSKYATYYIACSRSESEILHKKFHISSDKILTVSNFIEDKKIIDSKDKKKYEFLILGRVSADKRIEMILEEAKKLNIDRQFLVVGDGAQLDYLSHKYSNVNFAGHLSNPKVNEILSETKFIVSNSLIEGLPFAVIEAMHLGVVPILSDIPAHNDLISGCDDGFFFKNRSDLNSVLKKVVNIDLCTLSIYSLNARREICDLSKKSKEIFIKHFEKYASGN